MSNLSPYLPGYIIAVERPEWSCSYNSLRSLTINEPLRQLQSVVDRIWDKAERSRVHVACIDLFGVEVHDQPMYWQLSLRFLAFNVSEYKAYAAIGEDAVASYGGAPWIKSELVSTTHRSRSFYTRRPVLRRFTKLPEAAGFWIPSKLEGEAKEKWNLWSDRYYKDLFLQFHGKYRLVQVK